MKKYNVHQTSVAETRCRYRTNVIEPKINRIIVSWKNLLYQDNDTIVRYMRQGRGARIK